MEFPTFLHLGLIGWPLGHSLSPRLHSAALQALGLAGEYQLYPLPPLPEGQAQLAALVDQLRRGQIHGLNVTIPHKQAVLPLVDELTPAARAIGAANTLYLQSGRLVGDNTDAPGFMADLQRLGFLCPAEDNSNLGTAQRGEPEGRDAKSCVSMNDQLLGQTHNVLVLGAGGSARAVCWALAGAGWQVSIAARRMEQAAALAASLGGAARGLTARLLDADSLQGPFALMINTTPLGMFPQVESSPWPEGLPLPSGAAVYDLVYNPPETALLRAARAAGLPAANGLGMLIEQAALALEIWTGKNVPRNVMWDAIPS
jgi:shikimate dehydrogenase